MHSKLIEAATHEQLKSFLYEQFDELKRTMPELYEDMECELYEHIYGPHFTQWKYEKAVAELENRDGTMGPHWTKEQITDVAKQRSLVYKDFTEWDFAYAMNVVYSDFYGSIPDSVDSYFKVAKAWIEDQDAPKGKAFLYYKAMRD